VCDLPSLATTFDSGGLGVKEKYVSRVLGGTLLSQDSYKNTLAADLADAITTIL